MVSLGLAGRSIRAKLLGVVMATTCMALGLAGLGLVGYDALTYRSQKVDDLTAQAEMLGAISGAALTFDDAKAAQEYLATLKGRPSIRAGAIYAPGGRIFARYVAEGASPFPPGLEVQEGSRFEGDDVVVTRIIRQGREVLGSVHLRASLNLWARLGRYAGMVLFLSFFALGAALLLSGRLQSLISKPLLEVAEVARGVVERQDYSPRVAKRSEDEVGLLIQAFNEMLDQIQARERALQTANAALQSEIAEHKAAREEVAALNEGLEQRVAERTAELEILNRELESFSYSVSHDLRAPLRSIDGFTAILQNTYAGQMDEKGKGYMDRVRAATQRMGHLIDDLLRLSRTARSGMVRREIDLSQQAETILREFAEGTRHRKVRTVVHPGLRVHADSELMRTVMENLLGNAWKFTAKREGACIEVGVIVNGETPAYFVRDNGAGFDMKYVEKLFAPFQRLHSSSEFEGTGVGLANVQRIIHRHGGRVWCEGAVDAGATFYFTLPI